MSTTEGTLTVRFAGAVAARMRIFDSGICFIASHLSSGEQEGDELKRNADYADIVRRAGFTIDEPSAEPDVLSQVKPSAKGILAPTPIGCSASSVQFTSSYHASRLLMDAQDWKARCSKA